MIRRQVLVIETIECKGGDETSCFQEDHLLQLHKSKREAKKRNNTV